jgi:hypothetical protein
LSSQKFGIFFLPLSDTFKNYSFYSQRAAQWFADKKQDALTKICNV